MIENVFGIIATITSLVGLLPQVYKTYKIKSASDVSMVMLSNYLLCSLAWIIYGTYTESSFVVYSNVVGLMTSVISIMQKKYYDSLQ